MKSKVFKNIIIWFAGMVLIALIMNGIATLFVKEVIYDQLGILTNYVQKADSLLYPEEYVKTMDKPEKISAVLKLRTLLDDNFVDFDRGIKGDLVCTNIKIDTAVLFSVKDGDSDLSDGVWSAVCKENNGQMSTLEDTVGLLCVNDLCEMEYASQLYDVLKANPDAKAKLDSYAMKGYIIVPVSITVIDADGNEIAQLECKDVPDGYEKIEADDIYIYNVYGDNEFDRADECLYTEMELAYRGEREVDKIANDTQQQINNGSESGSTNDITWRFGKFTAKNVGVSENYSMVMVQEISYVKSAVLYVFLWGLVWTAVFWLVVLSKRREK